ncbi:hypothetical protein AMTRI_Chr01g134640 [Amborella trichopoda]|uniref:Uncharacterized protein n=1 Tax=Amborella trichopoda TaxID=13333 RepID=U5DDD7_AMBTC|nr:cyclin-A1-4 [Amborella trichopoda]ERN20534.1 hypothetical protein AMTR_s00068p00198800 [Amborella trichopoda]|eukprot:XP_006859067.1 cyclin-A1-4 [Amborella trichopoda]
MAGFEERGQRSKAGPRVPSLTKRVPLASCSTKRPANENNAKVPVVQQTQQAKRRAALHNLTNQCRENQGMIELTTTKLRKAPISHVQDAGTKENRAPTSSVPKSFGVVATKDTHLSRKEEPKGPHLPRKEEPSFGFVEFLAPCNSNVSPNRSDGDSVSMDETMSTCDSLKSPEFEYVDNAEDSIVALERKTCQNLYISKQSNEGSGLVPMDEDKFSDIDADPTDPQLCTAYACDIYNYLRESETKKRPAVDFMEGIQKDITASMRAILIDWLVEVAEEYRLVPDTLYLAVNFIDRYLSDNVVHRQRLQLLGVACMLIAAKYEEICAPNVEEFCYITDNTYLRDEVLQMESAVLQHLHFELTTPTAKSFLRRFFKAAQVSNEVPWLQLEFLANYLAELSLLEYSSLCYFPSLIAASAIFLAKFMLYPSKRPWNATLRHYTLYRPSDLRNCVKALEVLHSNSQSSNTNLPAIREKYSQHKYKCVAKYPCPPAIPAEFFQD